MSEENKNWYIFHTHAGLEESVVRSLEMKIETENMQNFFEKILIPMEDVQEVRKDGKRVITKRKFLNNYVLIKMEMNNKTRHLVQSIPRVLNFVGSTKDNEPTPLSISEVEKIFARINDSETAPQFKNTFEIGKSVRILDGSFKEFIGDIIGVNYDKNTLTVSLNIFGRLTPIEVDFSHVEKIQS